MATFSYTCDWKNQVTVRPRVLVAQFGDGYEQRQADGINTKPKIWQLKFQMRSNTEADAICDFLDTEGAVSAFDWTDPAGDAGKYICEQWDRVQEAYNLNTVTATFRQVFQA